MECVWHWFLLCHVINKTAENQSNRSIVAVMLIYFYFIHGNDHVRNFHTNYLKLLKMNHKNWYSLIIKQNEESKNRSNFRLAQIYIFEKLLIGTKQNIEKRKKIC